MANHSNAIRDELVENAVKIKNPPDTNQEGV